MREAEPARKREIPGKDKRTCHSGAAKNLTKFTSEYFQKSPESFWHRRQIYHRIGISVMAFRLYIV